MIGCRRRQPERNARQFHGERVLVHAIEAVERDQAAAGGHLGGFVAPDARDLGVNAGVHQQLLRVRLPARSLGARLLFGVPRAVGGKQVLGQTAAGAHQEMAGPHGGVADRQLQDLLRALVFSQRIDGAAHQVFDEGAVGVIGARLLAAQPGAKDDGAGRDGRAVQDGGWVSSCRLRQVRRPRRLPPLRTVFRRRPPSRLRRPRLPVRAAAAPTSPRRLRRSDSWASVTRTTSPSRRMRQSGCST